LPVPAPAPVFLTVLPKVRYDFDANGQPDEHHRRRQPALAQRASARHQQSAAPRAEGPGAAPL